MKKKKNTKIYAQRVYDAIEEELVSCGFDRELIADWLCIICQINLTSCVDDLIDIQNFETKEKKKISKKL